MKKLLTVLLVAVLACTFVFAQATNEKSDKDRTMISVLNYIDMSEPNSANEIAMIWDKFSEEHPEIRVFREDLFNEPYHQKLEAYNAQGNLPDVVYAWPGGRSASLHIDGSLRDLTDLLKRDGLYDKYMATCTAPQLGGGIEELPNGITATSMMFVNEKLLKENGLSIPKTYADLKAMVPVLNKKGIEVIGMDCMDGWVMQSCLFSLLCGRFGGADWYDRLVAGQTNFTDEWFVKALTVVDNLYKDGIINRNVLSIPYGTGRSGFAAGKCAIYIDGDWGCGSFQTDVTTGEALLPPEVQKNDIVLMNFPALDGEIIHESNSVTLGTGWGISADIEGEELEAAWELVKFLEGEYAQTWRLTTGASFPSLTTIDVDKVCEENNLEPLVAKRAQWYADIQVATPVVDSVLDPAVYEVINQVLAEIGLGTTTVAQGVKDVQAAWVAFNK